MTLNQVALASGVVTAIVIGQLLFKMSSQHLVTGQGLLRMMLSLLSVEFVTAIVLYFIGTLLWVVLLQSMTLGRAYPFMALSFALLPVLSYFVFSEEFSTRYLVGLGVFFVGLYIIATS